jgi:hypothetical protein
MAFEFLASNGPICQPGAKARTTGQVERRRRVRTDVHWPVSLFCANTRAALETTTVNLSSEGFYCVVNSKLTVGEGLVALLRAPSYDPTGKDRECVFRCEGRVLRVEPASVDGCFGIACRIEEYALARNVDGEPAAAKPSAGGSSALRQSQ